MGHGSSGIGGRLMERKDKDVRPLIVDKERLNDWRFDDRKAMGMLKTPAVVLHKNSENGCTGGGALL